MRTTLLTIGMALGLLQPAVAGGNSTIAKVTVSEIKIEEGKIVIKGSGMLRKRVISDAEHGDGTVFGRPAQWMHAEFKDCEFVMVPYFSRTDIEGVPTGKITDELRAKGKEWFVSTLGKARKVNAGDTVTIAYQRDRMTILGVRVVNMLGEGSLGIEEKKSDAK